MFQNRRGWKCLLFILLKNVMNADGENGLRFGVCERGEGGR